MREDDKKCKKALKMLKGTIKIYGNIRYSESIFKVSGLIVIVIIITTIII